MSAEDENNNNHNEEPVRESIKGLLAGEHEPMTPSIGGAQAGIDYTPLNFFRGSVTPDRLRHEIAAQHGGLAHWRHKTSRQEDYDDQVLQQARPNARAQAAAIAYGAATSSPGMGLESENFQSFMTGSHQIIPAMAKETPNQNTSVQQQPQGEANEVVRQPAPSVTRSDLPLQVTAGAEIYKYRSKKSVTFTNLLARARSILKA